MDLGNNIHLVKGSWWASNIYIINENPLTLVDTGMPYSLKQLEKTLHEGGKTIRSVELILHTHGHIDHIGSTNLVKEKSSALSCGHKLDETHFDKAHKYYGTNIITGLLSNVAGVILNMQPLFIDRYIFENETFDILGGLKVIHTPGHTFGSVCFYSEKYGILFSGDALQQRNGRIIKPKRAYSENPEQEEDSVQKLLELDFDKLFSGHHELIFSDAAKKLKKF